MTRPTFLVIAGSRPEAIKMAPIVQRLKVHEPDVCTLLCSTGQQLHMVPQAFAEFGLKPDIDLRVMTPNQSLASLTSRLASALDEAVGHVEPSWILVQGDTTSAMVAALLGFYRRLPVAHVEAGLRTNDLSRPFPEELNRRIISLCATMHFAPTERCARALSDEGIDPSRIRVTGNTVIDALLWTRARVRAEPSTLPQALRQRLSGRRLVLVTSHRRESFGQGLTDICLGLRDLIRLVSDIVIVLPVHPNPHVTATVERHLGGESRIVLIEPQPYRQFVELLDRSYLLLTDSGGLQEEAPSLGKPVLVLRETTERPEGVEAGSARLVGTSRELIVRSAVELLEDSECYARMAGVRNPYGDGTAAQRIVEALTDNESVSPSRAVAESDPLSVGAGPLAARAARP